jgi:Leucine-rich repeat (LRR) protein
LKNLKRLDLSHNRISQLPREILQLYLEIKWESCAPFEEGIFLAGNPLETPPVEIVKPGGQDIYH